MAKDRSPAGLLVLTGRIRRDAKRDGSVAVRRQRSVVNCIAMRGSRLISRWVGLSAVTPTATEFCGAAKWR